MNYRHKCWRLQQRGDRSSFKNFTFLGEKILGIFPSRYEFAWDLPQQLNDQCNMVCTDNERKETGGREEGRTRQTESDLVCQSVTGPPWVKGVSPTAL